MTKTLLTYVAGAHFNRRTCGGLRCGQPLRLVREPENPIDSSAIRIETLDQRKVGYIPRQVTGMVKFPTKAVVDPKGLWDDDPHVWMVVSMSEKDADPLDVQS